MPKQTFSEKMCFPVSAQHLFQWHEQAGAFERLTPPWEDVQVLEREGGIHDGAHVTLALGKAPFIIRWQIRHQGYVPLQQFQDIQESGPFAYWQHTHRIQSQGDTASVLEDTIEYELPFPWLSHRLLGPFIQSRLTRLFDYRHRIMTNDPTLSGQWNEVNTMKILITGASGFIGSNLSPFLGTQGHQVYTLVRRPAKADNEIYWNPDTGEIDAEKLEGLDAVIHLAGENIAEGRWTPAKKDRIRRSRVEPTTLLVNTLSQLKHPPKTFIGASATGYYGDRGEELLNEGSAAGSGFLPEVCQAWENVCQPLRDRGTRVANLRTGIVLSPKAGALSLMLPVFQMGGGGKLGSGKQYMSWIAIDDLIGAIYHILVNESVSGPVNGVSPNPVTNQEFTKTLGKVLHRPTLAPVPALAVNVMFGEMGHALLLSSQRVTPGVLQETGYRFQYPDLESALRHLLGK